MNEPRTDAVFHDYRSTPYVWHSRAINFNKLRLIGKSVNHISKFNRNHFNNDIIDQKQQHLNKQQQRPSSSFDRSKRSIGALHQQLHQQLQRQLQQRQHQQTKNGSRPLLELSSSNTSISSIGDGREDRPFVKTRTNKYRHEVKMNHRQYMDQTTANTTTTRTVAATNNNNNNNNAQYVPCTTGTRCPVHGGSQLNPTSTMPYRQLSNSPFESATNGANSYLMGYGGYPIYTDNHPHLHHHHHHPHHHHAQYLSPPLPLHHHYHPYYSSPIYIPGSPPGPYSHPIPMPYHSLYSYGKPLPPPPKISNQYRRMSHNAFEHGNNQPIRSNRTSPQTQPYTDEKIYRNKCRGHLIVLAIIMTVITIGVIMGIILAVTIN